MVDESSWKQLKKQAFEAFQANGKMEVQSLEKIIEAGCADGEFDDQEKADLISIISNLTRADLSDSMWAKVAELIHKFELDHDRDASIEDLNEEDQAP